MPVEQLKNKLNIKIIVAAHKKYRMPQSDIYLPLHVGAEGKEPIGYQGDNIGDNISVMNPYFCELTGLYWAWKNLHVDYLGLAHYRRHFCFKKKKAGSGSGTCEKKDNNGRNSNKEENKWASVLSTKEALQLCEQYDVIVPTKRRYIIETLESHYSHTHYKEHLDKTREIIAEKYPEYLSYYDASLRRRSGYMFNMFLMRADLANEYCQFLFDVLFELDKQIDTSDYSVFQARYPGRVGEILFNVWLDKESQERGLKVKQIRCIHMEPINWWNKGMAFLKAKFIGKRYEHGF